MDFYVQECRFRACSRLSGQTFWLWRFSMKGEVREKSRRRIKAG